MPAAQLALGRFFLAGVLPIFTFYAFFRISGPVAGIVGGMTMSFFALAVQTWRLRRVDPVVLVPMTVILIQGSAAVVLSSVELYLAAPAVEALLWGTALTISVLTRRPLIRVIARELGLIPTRYADSTAVGHALGHVTLAWAAAAFLKAGVRLWLLQLLSVEAFLVTITAFTMSVNAAVLAFSFWWPLRAVRAEERGRA